jgi:intermediate peptidase
MRFVDGNVEKAKRILVRVQEASTVEEYRRIVRDLDRLSDMLCRVIDLSDFVRATHPDRRMQIAATQAYSKMFEFMNVLNTTRYLNDQLAVAMQNPEVVSTWTEEEQMAAKRLQKDFAQSAIALPKTVRERFVSLSQEISEVSHDFVEQMRPAKSALSFPSSKVNGLDPRMAKNVTKWGMTTIPLCSEVANSAMATVRDEGVRKELYIANRTASRAQLERLDDMLRKRAELAKLTGFSTYAHLTLQDKMSKSPESVTHFLKAMSKGNEVKAKKEATELLAAKSRGLTESAIVLQPWDKDYHMCQLRSSMPTRSRQMDSLPAYFSMGTVMQGLSRLFTRLYGIRLVPREPLNGETWHDHVRCLDIVSDSDGRVAVLYCDLFSRPGKSPNPAHFTLRCSREITRDELQEEALHMDASMREIFSGPEESVNDGMATSTASGTLKQLPTIALICDFDSHKGSGPCLLSFHEVQTLFHEMGHAIHSILGRTNLQEVSGTRCATDFAELPSVLMEHFAADPEVLKLFARHYITDESVPYELVAQKIAIDKKFEGLETASQIVLAMLDQAYHSELPMQKSFDTTWVFHDIQKQHGILPPDPAETSWQGFFGHLSGYGGAYYSYLFDQTLADHVWKEVFRSGKSGGSIDRENGEKWKESVLKWGGGRDPWKCLAEVLNDGRVEQGGKEAMAVVGSWRKGQEV